MMSQVAPSRQAQRPRGGMEPEEETGALGCLAYVMYAGSILLFLLFFPLSLVSTLKVIQEHERAAIFRLGRVKTKVGGDGPGLIFILPCIDELRVYDLRTHSFNIKPQQVLTKDSLSITVDAVVFARVTKLTRAVMYLSDPYHAARLRAATTLRKFVGMKTMFELLTDRRLLNVDMQKSLDKSTVRWGMKIERVALKDIKMPSEMQRSMATEAETERRAKAKVIAADGEMKAAHALKDAATIINQSEAGIQLRYLETMRSVSKKNNNTVILPVPPNLLQAFLRK